MVYPKGIRSRWTMLCLAAAVAVLAAGCGSAASKSAGNAPAPVVLVAKNATLGDILVDAHGMTLYRLTKDTAGQSTCNDACAKNWPPLVGAGAVAGDAGVKGKLETSKRADGTVQVTLNGMPLYTYVKDLKAGDALGHGVAGVWQALKPDGSNAVAVSAPSSGGGYAY